MSQDQDFCIFVGEENFTFTVDNDNFKILIDAVGLNGAASAAASAIAAAASAEAAEAAAEGAGGVTTFNGRSGAVSPASADYSVAQVTGAAPLASPTLTGVPAAPTAVAGTNTTQIATTGFVAAAITAILGGVAGAFDTLFELAAGKIGGSTGVTDNRLLRSDGVGGITAQNSAVTMDDSGNTSGVGTLDTTGKITADISDATNSGVTRPLKMSHKTSGAPAVGIGVGIEAVIETATGENYETVGTVDFVSTNVTAASENVDFVAQAMIGGTLAELFRVTSAGVMTFLASALKRVLTADGGMTLGGGFIATSYGGYGGVPPVVTTGTVTPAPGAAQANIQHYTNNGAHTLAPPANPCTVYIEITNGASAGAITTSGFNKVDGVAFNTTNGKIFGCSIVKGNAKSTLTVKLLN